MNPDAIRPNAENAVRDATTDISMILNILGVRHGDGAVVAVLARLGLRRKQEGD